MQYRKISEKVGLSLEQQAQLLSEMCNNCQEPALQCPAKIIGLPECPHYYNACAEVEISNWEAFLKNGRNCAIWSHFFD